MPRYAGELAQPYALDTTSAIVQTLLSNGVGIYFSDDSRATVTNLVDGSAGTATDITTNQRGTDQGTYSIGYALTGLTAEQQAEVNADPFAVCKPKAAETLDHGLNWGAGDSHIAISGLAGTVTAEMTLAKDMQLLTAETGYLYDCRNLGGVTRYYSSYGGDFIETGGVTDVKVNGVAATGTDVANAVAGDTISVNLGTINGTLHVGAGYTGVSAMHTLGLSGLKITDDNGLHIIDLNRTSGDPVDLTGGLTCTLVGFPAEAGYVVENGEIVGYRNGGSAYAALPSVFRLEWNQSSVVKFRFRSTSDSIIVFGDNDDKHLLMVESNAGAPRLVYRADSGTYYYFPISVNPLDGAWHEFIISHDYSAATTTVTLDGVSEGTGNLDLRNTHIYRLSGYATISPDVTWDYIYLESVGVRTGHWDFTTGDADQIRELISGNHATITGEPTSGWLPVVPRQVFSIGTNKDYATIYNFVYSNKAPSDGSYLVGVVHESHSSSQVKPDTHSGIGFNSAQCTYEIRGVAPLDFTNPITVSTSPFSSRDYGGVPANKTLIVKDLKIAASGLSYTVGGSCDIIFDNVWLKTASSTSTSTILSGNATLKNSLVDAALSTGAITTLGDNTYIYDSIWIGGTTSSLGMFRPNGTTPKFYNVLVRNVGSDYIFHGSNGSDYLGNGVIVDNNVTLPGGFTNSRANVDFTGAFVDEVNDDYRISQSWADTNLVGQGWNGSDIAGWAYYQSAGGPELYSFTGVVTVGVSTTTTYNKIAQSAGGITAGVGVFPSLTKSTVVAGAATAAVSLADSYTKVAVSYATITSGAALSGAYDKRVSYSGAASVGISLVSEARKISTQGGNLSLGCDIISSANKIIPWLGTVSTGAGLAGVNQKRAVVSGTIGVAVSVDGSFVKIENGLRVFTGVIGAGLGLTAAVSKRTQSAGNINLGLGLPAVSVKVTNLQGLVPTTCDLGASALKFGATAGVIGTAAGVIGRAAKVAQLQGTIPVTVDLVGSFYDVAQAVSGFTARIDGAVVYARMDGRIPSLRIDGTVPVQRIDGQTV